MRLIAGEAYGHRAPAKTFGPMFYAHAALNPGAAIDAPTEHAERALYVADGAGEVDGTPIETGTMAVLHPDAPARFVAKQPTTLMLLGGAPLDGPRFIWWNFVSSSKARIEQAKADWQAGRFARVPGDEIDFIPLPDAVGP